MKTNHLITCLIMTAMLFCSCSKEKEMNPQPKNVVLTPEQRDIVDASNQFGFKLLHGLVQDEPGEKNIFISPLSIELALSMTLNGAAGTTSSSMRETMQFSNMDLEEINQAFHSLMKELTSLDPKVVTEIANSIWYRNSFAVQQDFIHVNRDYYDAVVEALDFDSPNAKNVINSWVADKTRNKIRSVVDEINPEHVMFLINAIYFKGAWKNAFDPRETSDQAFRLPSGSTKIVPTMKQNESFPAYFGESYAAAELLYGRGNFSMVILLPEVDSSVEEILEAMDPEEWNALMETFSPVQMEIRLPRFRFAYETKLNDILSDMGMGVAFTEFADFRGINPDAGLYISEVKHKTYVEVNEEGTEAAAVTSVGVGVTSMPPSFTVNRPFLFAIREKISNTILFIGCVREPLTEGE
jgi:serine protease inhibitor